MFAGRLSGIIHAEAVESEVGAGSPGSLPSRSSRAAQCPKSRRARTYLVAATTLTTSATAPQRRRFRPGAVLGTLRRAPLLEELRVRSSTDSGSP